MDRILGRFALIGKSQQGSFQQGSRVGTGNAGIGEHGDRGGGVVDAHTEGM